ncbi:hypothetical protein CEP54_008958 [Fusarium duplospermum]|uniref:Carboxylic ester hydrolase n=1 Tax=Fusarium duplospermum TaxID=1325734 RepID=A0A428PT37_9HYPO|nr:hypothetical protein CEP54_008958 [Fusarium duplospermum]
MAGPVMSGSTDSYFWTHLVMQFSHFEPTVRHAVLAISSLYEEFARGSRITRQICGSTFAIGHYNAAIQKIKASGDEQLILLLCILFICIEYLQGDIYAALEHCRHDIIVLDNSSCPEWAHKYLVPIFRRLSIIPFFLGGVKSMRLPSLIGFDPAMPEEFNNIAEAQSFIDNLMLRSMECVLDEIDDQKSTLATLLDQSEVKAKNLVLTIPASSITDRYALYGMRLKHKVTSIYLQKPRDASEIWYDQHLDTFRDVVDMARNASETWETARQKQVPDSSFTFEMGFLPLMFFVVIKCRSLTTRVEALACLAQLGPAKEGLFDVGTLYRVGRRLIELEHGISLDDGAMGYDDSNLGDDSLPPEEARFFAVPVKHELEVISGQDGSTHYERQVHFLQRDSQGQVVSREDQADENTVNAGGAIPRADGIKYDDEDSFLIKGHLFSLKSPVHAASLSDICSKTYAKSALPADGFISGITIDPNSIQTALVSNASFQSEWYPTASADYCNLTFAYSHDGIADDIVNVSYLLPAPSKFQNRYVSTGGGGLAINSGSQYAGSGLIVGAVSGITDGGFGSFNTQWDEVFLLANGTINWQSVYMFGYQAHHELALLGKELARNIYDVSKSSKVYSYYQGCSEGGREGWSQVQRFADQFDGAAIGAPAFRYGQQQVNHLFGNVVEQTLDYFPSSCELEKILNLTITACDGLDGREDGVVSRSDLCKLNFNLNSTIGTPYSCEASNSTGGPMLRARQFSRPSTPAQNGTITAEAVAVIQQFLDGLHDSESRRVYLNYQPGSGFSDTATSYDEETDTWGLSISDLGGEWVARYLQLKDTSTLESLDNVTYDTLKEWMIYGMNKYANSLQTTHPDLSDFHSAGGKVIHVHGESDDSIPAGSSVRYYDSVRNVMFPDKSYNESVAAVDDFYRLFLVPGGAHCGSNSNQPNGGWPQTTLQTVIE